MKAKEKIAIIIGFIAFLGAVLLYQDRAPKPDIFFQGTARSSVVMNRAGRATPLANTKGQQERSGLSVAEAVRQVANTGPMPKLDKLISDSDRNLLKDFSILSKKVFLNDIEKARRESLLRDEKFIKSLKPIFSLASQETEARKLQNDSLDLVLSALNGPSPNAPREVLSSIVSDNQVENKQLSLSDRKFLAGLKAEALFRWSAQEPQQLKLMSSLLPGPVSQKIWLNVQAAQKANLAESATVITK